MLLLREFQLLLNRSFCRYNMLLSFVQRSAFFHSTSIIRSKNYYAVLGLNSNASAEDIKSAYYGLSQKFHPDKHCGKNIDIATSLFFEISEAHEILGNPVKKAEYDENFRKRGLKDNTTGKNAYKFHVHTPPKVSYPSFRDQMKATRQNFANIFQGCSLAGLKKRKGRHMHQKAAFNKMANAKRFGRPMAKLGEFR